MAVNSHNTSASKREKRIKRTDKDKNKNEFKAQVCTKSRIPHRNSPTYNMRQQSSPFLKREEKMAVHATFVLLVHTKPFDLHGGQLLEDAF